MEEGSILPGNFEGVGSEACEFSGEKKGKFTTGLRNLKNDF